MNRIEQLRRQRPAAPLYFLAVLALLVAQGQARRALAQSQWGTNGTNIHNTNVGYVGVGTTSPNSTLHVVGPATGSGPTIRADGGGDVVLAGSGALFFDGNYSWASGNYIRPLAPNTQSFFTSGAERMRITPSGNVGIGTTAPQKALEIIGGLRVQNEVSVGGPGAFEVDAPGVVGGRFKINPDGKVGIGTAAPTERLHVVGNINVTGNINAKYQDLAEWVPSTQRLAAGTVVVLDTARSNHVLASSTAYDTRVAGVVSAQPGVLLGERGEGKLMVATTGRVKVRVDATRGPVRVGDLLVTSDVEGLAMKSEPAAVGGRQMHLPGTLIGKALEPLEKGVGEILVLLSLQ